MNKKQESPDDGGINVWDPKDLEAAVAAAIEACGGDARAAVAALVVANTMLEAELERALARLSTGYVRGKYRLVKTHDIGREESAGE